MMQLLDKHGFPVERICGRRLTNIIRLLLHTRRIKTELQAAEAAKVKK